MKANERQKVTDSELLTTIKQIQDPCFTAAELSERLPLTRQGINGRLHRLEEGGLIDHKRSGSGQVWWIVDQPDS